MKVTYNSPHFYIDGVQVINPEVLPVTLYMDSLLGCDLPENIIAEKEYQRHTDGEWMSATKDQFERRIKSGHFNEAREVYRLKLKEPLLMKTTEQSKQNIILKYGTIAVDIASSIEPKLTTQEEAIFIAGFQECIKYQLKEPLENIFKNERDIGPEISKYLVDTGSKETQEQLFDDMFRLYFDLRHELMLSGDESRNKIQELFTITRK